MGLKGNHYVFRGSSPIQSKSIVEDTLLHHCKFGTKPKHGSGQRQQQPGNAASSESTSENTRQQIILNSEDVDYEEERLGREEANMETDGKYSTEEVNQLNQ